MPSADPPRLRFQASALRHGACLRWRFQIPANTETCRHGPKKWTRLALYPTISTSFPWACELNANRMGCSAAAPECHIKWFSFNRLRRCRFFGARPFQAPCASPVTCIGPVAHPAAPGFTTRCKRLDLFRFGTPIACLPVNNINKVRLLRLITVFRDGGNVLP
jgi:hypothetical protein